MSSEDPKITEYERVLSAFDMLGIDTQDVRRIVSVLIDARKVTVVRLRLDDAGKPYMAGDELATETVVIAIDYPAKKVAS